MPEIDPAMTHLGSERLERRARCPAARAAEDEPAPIPPSSDNAVRYLTRQRAPMRQALKRLAEENRLSPAPQRGWFVTTSRTIGEPPSVLQSFTEMAHARGLVPTAKVLVQKQRPARFDEAEKLMLAPAADVLELVRLRRLDGVPVCVDSSVVALSRAPGIADIDMTDRSLYATLREEAKVEIARSDYTVHAEIADDEAADLLSLEPGAAVLIGEEVGFSLDEQPVLIGRVAYRGDAYRFRATLFRPLSR